MATAISFNTAKSMTIAALQASQTQWATTVDGSNEQYSSDAEIASAILTADGIVCTAIAGAMQSPYQTTFLLTSGALAAPAQPITARNGVVLKILTTSGFDTNWVDTDVSVPNNYITLLNHGLITGQKVRLTTGGALPAPLAVATDYYVIRVSASTFRFATTAYNAYTGNAITMTDAGSGASQLVSEYIEGTLAKSKDEVVQAWQNPAVFTTQGRSGACGFWFIEGDQVYCSSPTFKIVYTDYTLTASPQAPEPFLDAVVSGAINILAKDGSDAELAQFNGQQFQMYLQAIAQGAAVLSPLQTYKR